MGLITCEEVKDIKISSGIKDCFFEWGKFCNHIGKMGEDCLDIRCDLYRSAFPLKKERVNLKKI